MRGLVFICSYVDSGWKLGDAGEEDAAVAMMSWHAYFYESLDSSRPPAFSFWIEAESESEARKIALGRLGRCRRAELVRPFWEEPTPPLMVMSDPRADEWRRHLN